MHNVLRKCLEKILRAKNQDSLAFEKSFFWHEILNSGLPGVWFSKNRQKCLSAVAKSFLRVVWSCKLYQKLAWTLRSVFDMYINILRKCLEQILQAKNQASLAFEKSFFWHEILDFGLLGVWFSKNRQKCLSAVAKSFLRIVWCYNLYQELGQTLRSVFRPKAALNPAEGRT